MSPADLFPPSHVPSTPPLPGKPFTPETTLWMQSPPKSAAHYFPSETTLGSSILTLLKASISVISTFCPHYLTVVQHSLLHAVAS
jgi:hypothetical protein